MSRCFGCLLALLTLAACATSNEQVSRGAPKDGTPGEGRAAVAAFAQICVPLDRAEVAQRATRYGFAPIRREALPPAAAASLPPATTPFLRPGTSTPMLFWNDAGRCELVGDGLPTAEVEAEFARLLATLGASPNLAVAAASPEQLATLPADGPARPRQAAVVTPRALVAGAQRTIVLSVAPEGPRGPVVSMAMQRFSPTADTVPTTPRELPKDPIRL